MSVPIQLWSRFKNQICGSPRIIHPRLLPMYSHVAWLHHDDLDHRRLCLVLLKGGNSSSSSGASSSRRSSSRFSYHGATARSKLSRCKIVHKFASERTVAEWFASVELDRPHALMIEFVMVRSDEDDSHALPKRMTNEDVMRMQCRTAADIISTYSLYAIQCSTIHQYTSAQNINGHQTGRDGSFIGNSGHHVITVLDFSLACITCMPRMICGALGLARSSHLFIFWRVTVFLLICASSGRFGGLGL